ncbi:TetR/AcrR family transcriptional regulator [Cellulomonas sp. PhB143]|uniref:TetR/AcrR family transcriptional regulator n=1 Tax=Cellulomonas sp. PhB143 TaxID=2485186 RepID=UPI001F1B293A|nr:TetR/AcrR family transcriptional regulator [Cellulomonas sp. PhB143]
MQETPDQPVGLRERKKRLRRAALVDAAHALVRERGLDGVTVEAVCARVGVSTRTFFNYFASKDDAVLGIVPIELSEATTATFTAGGPSGRLVDDLLPLIAECLEGPLMTPERVAAVLEIVHDEPRLVAHQMAWMESQLEGMRALLAARARATRTGVEPDLVITVAMAVFRAAYLRWERDGAAGSLPDAVGPALEDLRALLRE